MATIFQHGRHAIISAMEKQHDIRSIALHPCNMHVGICRSSMYWGVEFSGRSGTFASEVKSAIRLLYRLNRPTELCLCLPFCILLLQLYITNTVTSRSMGEVGMIGPHWMMNRREVGNCLFSCGYRRPGCIDGGAQGYGQVIEKSMSSNRVYSRNITHRSVFLSIT